MPVDPEQLFIYWELTDEAIADAGGDPSSAALALRVYDTTHRLFDGHNAHSQFDIPIQRSDRQWFCHVGKPTSTAHVELGFYAHSGFVPLCRSSRVDFPRRESAPPGPVEWMSVSAETGEPSPSSGGAGGVPSGLASGSEGAGSSGPGPTVGSLPSGTVGPEGAPLAEADSVAAAIESFSEVRTESEWSHTIEERHGEWLYSSYTQSEHSSEWQSVEVHSAWESGPFPVPVEVPEPTVARFEGPTRVTHVKGKTRILHGPWQVVIRGLNARWSRRVEARWQVYRTWQQEEVRTAEPASVDSSRPKGSSERVHRGASELRFMGSSEVFYAGASELRLAGASERLIWGQSELRFAGASERRFAGASEWRIQGVLAYRGGASERHMGGASERVIRGGSERRFAGASENNPRPGTHSADSRSYPPLPTVDKLGSSSQ